MTSSFIWASTETCYECTRTPEFGKPYKVTSLSLPNRKISANMPRID